MHSFSQSGFFFVIWENNLSHILYEKKKKNCDSVNKNVLQFLSVSFFKKNFYQAQSSYS